MDLLGESSISLATQSSCSPRGSSRGSWVRPSTSIEGTVRQAVRGGFRSRV
jgi:hypothetical protein